MRHTVVLICLAFTFIMDFVYRHKGCVYVWWSIPPPPSLSVICCSWHCSSARKGGETDSRGLNSLQRLVGRYLDITVMLSRRSFDKADLGNACFLTWVMLKDTWLIPKWLWRTSVQADSAETLLLHFCEVVVDEIAVLYLQCLARLSNIILTCLCFFFFLLFIGWYSTL